VRLDDPPVRVTHGRFPKKTAVKPDTYYMSGATNVYITAENLSAICRPNYAPASPPPVITPFRPLPAEEFFSGWFDSNAHAYDGTRADDPGNGGTPPDPAFGRPLRGRVRCAHSRIDLRDQTPQYPPDVIRPFQGNLLTTETRMGLLAYFDCGFVKGLPVSQERINIVQSYLPVPLPGARPGRKHSVMWLVTVPRPDAATFVSLRGAKVDATPWLLPKDICDEWGKDFHRRMKEEVCFDPSFWRGDAEAAGPPVRLGPPAALPDGVDAPGCEVTVPVPPLGPAMRGMVILAPRAGDIGGAFMAAGDGTNPGNMRGAAGLGITWRHKAYLTPGIPPDQYARTGCSSRTRTATTRAGAPKCTSSDGSRPLATAGAGLRFLMRNAQLWWGRASRSPWGSPCG
jgi:hypothetical protein